MLQVLETVFDLLVNHTRMLRWHEDAVARHQSEADCLQARFSGSRKHDEKPHNSCCS